MLKPLIVFFDFDNTITQEDVLSRVIKKFSINQEWEFFEDQWREGKIGSKECLEEQLSRIRATWNDILPEILKVPLDPAFVKLRERLAQLGIPCEILSDSFSIFIRAVLEFHGIRHLPIYANEVRFEEGGLIVPAFPYSEGGCGRCAHCKRLRLRQYQGHTRIYVGDGMSDVCAALEADKVFAKGDLKKYLLQGSRDFEAFETLEDIHCYFSRKEISSRSPFAE